MDALLKIIGTLGCIGSLVFVFFYKSDGGY
jgi:hypothetical protein